MQLTEKLKGLLVKAGLSEAEILFYLAALKNPGSSIYKLARQAKLSKNQAYRVYTRLSELGILMSPESAWKKKINPVPLYNFSENLKKKSRRMFKTAEGLRLVTPLLDLMNEKMATRSIQMVEGQEMVESYLDLIDFDWDRILAYGTYDMFMKEFSGEAEKRFIRNRVKKGKRATGIFANPGPYTREVVKFNEQDLRESRSVEWKQLENDWINIFPGANKLAIYSKDQEGIFRATMIESPELCRIHENIFSTFWDVQKT